MAPQAAAILAALILAGCASTFDVLPEKMGGLPASAPARSTDSNPYPNVYAPDPRREVQKLSDDEQKTAELELLAMREEQNQRVNPQPLEPEPVKKKPLAKKKGATKEAAKKPPGDKAAARKPAEKQSN